jgi:hypothetical protein
MWGRPLTTFLSSVEAGREHIMTTTKLTRTASVCAVAAGLLFVFVQFIHPTETVANVTTTRWAVTHYLTVAMAVLGLVGVSGVYLRQVRQAGITGLAGFVLFGLFFLVTVPLAFVEAFVLPLLAKDAPGFVTGYLALSAGGDTSGLGALALAPPVSFVLYLAGGLLFGIALFRARVLARWPAVLLAAGTVATLVLPLLPHSLGRLAAIPVGIALAGLGFSLWRNRSTTATAAAVPAEPAVAR